MYIYVTVKDVAFMAGQEGVGQGCDFKRGANCRTRNYQVTTAY